MVLDDVAQRARLLVEAAPVLDSQRLCDGDLHVVDVAPVPDGFEDGVREAQRQQVLHRLLPEVVVDPVDLGLVEDGVHAAVELERAVEVAPVGLLDHHSGELAARRRPVQVVGAEGLDDLRERRGRRGQVMHPIAARAALAVMGVEHLVQAGERVGVVVLARDEPEAGAQLVPDGAGVGRGLAGAVAELVVGELAAGHADHRERGWEGVARRQPGERGQELASRQVAGRAEHDEHARRRHALAVGLLEQRVGVSHFSVWNLCPPNWFRSAAIMRGANESGCCDENRA